MTENEIATVVVDAAYKVFRTLGPGLLESVYEVVLAYELERRGLSVQRQVPLPVVYEEIRFEAGFRLDLVVNGLVVIELKSVENIAPVHKKQVLTYFRLSGCKLGLLINFGLAIFMTSISRVVTDFMFISIKLDYMHE